MSTWKEQYKRERKNPADFIEAICPNCKRKHVVYIFWTGRGIPRVYCPECKPRSSIYSERVDKYQIGRINK